MKQFILLTLLIFAFFLPLKAQTALVPEQKTVAFDTSLRQQTFDRVWNTINEKHFDPTFGGVDWKKVREIYQPKALSVASDAEFYGVLQDMLGELHQSHFSIIPPGAELTPTISGEGEIGIDVQLIGQDVVVTRVNADSSAAKSGIKMGYIIQKINGKPVIELLAPVEERLAKRKDTAAMKIVTRRRALLAALSGKIGSIVTVEVLDAKDKPRTFEVERLAFTGEMSKPMGNFAAQRLFFESKRLANNIGYIKFNIWVLPQLPKIREAIRSMLDTKGIILDLRGNPGGFGVMTTALAGSFLSEQNSLGTSRSRNSVNKFTIYPQENSFAGKVVILTDSGTGSASEVFTAGMQGIKRATVVGETTAGAVLPAVIEKLPGGATFLYAISDYKSPTGVLVEGRGITPDVEVKLTRKSLLKEQDLQLEAAVKEALK